MKIFILFLLINIPSLLSAGEIYEFYNGVRSLGMGGARIAVVNDETALLINPAGLGKLRDKFLTMVDPEIELGETTQGLIITDLTAFLSPQKTLDLLNARPTHRMHQRIQVFPSIVFKNFGLGLFGRYSMDASVDTSTSLLSMDYRNDFAFVFGFNFRFWGGRVKLGFNAKVINRIEISRDDIPTSSTGLTVGSLASEGLGVGSDVGLILSAPWTWLPTLAFTYRDVGSTKYDVTNGLFLGSTTRPQTTEPKLDGAIAFFPILSNSTRLTLTGEYRDILTPTSQISLDRRLHYGLEFNFSDAFFIRGGMHQGRWTAGLELAMRLYQFQVATYAEDIGTNTSSQFERRYVGKMVFRF